LYNFQRSITIHHFRTLIKWY